MIPLRKGEGWSEGWMRRGRNKPPSTSFTFFIRLTVVLFMLHGSFFSPFSLWQSFSSRLFLFAFLDKFYHLRRAKDRRFKFLFPRITLSTEITDLFAKRTVSADERRTLYVFRKYKYVFMLDDVEYILCISLISDFQVSITLSECTWW